VRESVYGRRRCHGHKPIGVRSIELANRRRLKRCRRRCRCCCPYERRLNTRARISTAARRAAASTAAADHRVITGHLRFASLAVGAADGARRPI